MPVLPCNARSGRLRLRSLPRRRNTAAEAQNPREGGEWLTLPNRPVAAAEQVSVEEDGAAVECLKGSRLHLSCFLPRDQPRTEVRCCVG